MIKSVLSKLINIKFSLGFDPPLLSPPSSGGWWWRRGAPPVRARMSRARLPVDPQRSYAKCSVRCCEDMQMLSFCDHGLKVIWHED